MIERARYLPREAYTSMPWRNGTGVTREIVRDGIAALPAKHQAVIVLFYLRGRSITETAEILGIPAGTVKSRLHFGLRSLRGRLEEDRRFGGAYRPLAGAVVVGVEP